MAKRFKLRISRVLPSFQSCRSKELPENPLPAIFHLSPVNPKAFDLNFPAPPPPTPPSLKRHVSSAIVSIGCGCPSKSNRPILTNSPSADFQWQKDEKWHVIAKVPNRRHKISTIDSSDDSSFPSATTDGTRNGREKSKSRMKKLKKKKKKKKSRSNVRISTSSFDHSGWFSSTEKEDGFYHNEYGETETLVSSSRSFSDDSFSDFSSNLKTIQERKPPQKGFKRVKPLKKKSGNIQTFPTPETDSPGRLSVFRRLVPCGVEGKVRESFAVVKRSDDPYGDFRRSMLEMILEKEMYDKGDLEQLLHCFLSLNSQAHHRVIVEAFSEIWEILFCKSSRNGFSHVGL
ncbi:transcription repressor OFP7 [Magnolia sinica]|uniref:transcription repressor OFP7 n=1 Tax=Magnolia sinica TaxID=86752 RepID=UPI00265A6827|nr:transcription repressor OFP7 [Magnolia sinica]